MSTMKSTQMKKLLKDEKKIKKLMSAKILKASELIPK